MSRKRSGFDSSRILCLFPFRFTSLMAAVIRERLKGLVRSKIGLYSVFVGTVGARLLKIKGKKSVVTWTFLTAVVDLGFYRDVWV